MENGISRVFVFYVLYNEKSSLTAIGVNKPRMLLSFENYIADPPPHKMLKRFTRYSNQYKRLGEKI